MGICSLTLARHVGLVGLCHVVDSGACEVSHAGCGSHKLGVELVGLHSTARLQKDE